MAGGTLLAPRVQSLCESEAAETAPARGAAVSNAQHDQLNKSNTDQQYSEGKGIVFEPMSTIANAERHRRAAFMSPKKSQHGRAARVFDRRPFTVRSAKAILSLSAVSSQGAIAKRYCVDSRRTGRITPSASPPCALTHPRHARPCAGHPRLLHCATKTWMAGTSPAMTVRMCQSKRSGFERSETPATVRYSITAGVFRRVPGMERCRSRRSTGRPRKRTPDCRVPNIDSPGCSPRQLDMGSCRSRRGTGTRNYMSSALQACAPKLGARRGVFVS